MCVLWLENNKHLRLCFSLPLSVFYMKIADSNWWRIAMAFQIRISMCANVCNSTQARVIWEKGASVKKMPSEDWPIDKPVAFS